VESNLILFLRQAEEEEEGGGEEEMSIPKRDSEMRHPCPVAQVILAPLVPTY